MGIFWGNRTEHLRSARITKTLLDKTSCDKYIKAFDHIKHILKKIGLVELDVIVLYMQFLLHKCFAEWFVWYLRRAQWAIFPSKFKKYLPIERKPHKFNKNVENSFYSMLKQFKYFKKEIPTLWTFLNLANYLCLINCENNCLAQIRNDLSTTKLNTE